MAFFAIKAKKGPMRTTFKTQCKKHQKHSVKWPFLKKCFIPFVKKGLFFELFSKCFQNTAFLIDKTRKKTMFLTNPKKSESEKGHFTELFCLFFIDDVFSSFLTRFDEKKSFSRVFLLVFSRPRAQACF